MPERVFLGLGSNWEEAEKKLASAREGISALSGTRMVRFSSVYLTEPQGFREQPWFYNQVLELKVDARWEPEGFLKTLLALETALGRIRDPHQPRFGPRVIDIDLLLFGEKKSQTVTCTVPHPRMLARAFVLCPLLEIAPDLYLSGEAIQVHLARLNYRCEGKRLFQA